MDASNLKLTTYYLCHFFFLTPFPLQCPARVHLSPPFFLFSTVINGITNSPSSLSTELIFYADDILLFLSINSLSKVKVINSLPSKGLISFKITNTFSKGFISL